MILDWLSRRWFYNFEPLGIQIYKDYRRLCKRNPGAYNYSVDRDKYISFDDIQWSVAHRINISKEDAHLYPFLKYVPHEYFINNPTVKNT